jgi:hypothetical protein
MADPRCVCPPPLCPVENYFSGVKLPPANLSNLQKMNGVFDGEHNPHMKERLANSVAAQVRSSHSNPVLLFMKTGSLSPRFTS